MFKSKTVVLIQEKAALLSSPGFWFLEGALVHQRGNAGRGDPQEDGCSISSDADFVWVSCEEAELKAEG